MIFFGVKVSDRGCLRFLVHFHHRDIADVEMIDQILALRGNNDLCVYGRILNHFCQLADGIGMQAKFRFIQMMTLGIVWAGCRSKAARAMKRIDPSENW